MKFHELKMIKEFYKKLQLKLKKKPDVSKVYMIKTNTILLREAPNLPC